jgi:hypothetical protein
MVAVPPGLPKLQRWLAILLPIAQVCCGEEKIGEVEHVGFCGLRAAVCVSQPMLICVAYVNMMCVAYLRMLSNYCVCGTRSVPENMPVGQRRVSKLMMYHIGHSADSHVCDVRLTFFKHGDLTACKAAAVTWLQHGLSCVDRDAHRRCGRLVPRIGPTRLRPCVTIA